MNFKLELKKIGLELDDEKLDKFNKYYEILIAKNEVMNLTAITEYDEVYIKHFYDSLTIGKYLIGNENICDVGSGAGFPSIPLAIMYPNIKVTIIDALNKRINFLNDLVKELKLNNVIALHYRAEEYALEKRSSFDAVCARAVAALPMLCELCMPLVKTNGHFIAMKGSNAIDEVNNSKNAIKLLGGKIEKIDELKLPYDMGDRTIVVIDKISETNKKYPRIFKQIKERPL